MNAPAGVTLNVMAVHVDDDLGELLELVDEQLQITPAARLQRLLGAHWPRCEQAIAAAAAAAQWGVLVGPVAVAVHGGPQQPGDGRVDLLCAADAQDDVAYALIFNAGAHVGRSWRAGPDRRDEMRMHFSADAGELTLRTEAAGISDPTGVVARGELVDVGGAIVRVASLEDLAAITFASPWGQDGPYRSGLRALRAHRAVNGVTPA